MLLPRCHRILLLLLGAAVVLLGLALPARAHEGPPFPLMMDQRVGSMMVSVWADPDIGTGTFYVVLEPADGATLPEDITVEVGVWPVSGRLEEVRYQAEPQRVRYGARYIADVQFDQGEWWDVRILLHSSAGSAELTAEVEATPDGSLGPISLVIYLVPFLLVGGLWLKAVLRQRRAASPDSSSPDSSS